MSADEVRQACSHEWQRVGFEERDPRLVAVIYVCEKCSSFTYREMKFIGFRLDSLDDEAEGETSEPRGGSS